MSAEINNREYRQKILKEIISELHTGKDVEAVRAKFAETFEGVSAEEISQAEQALIMDGLPVSEVQRLCDVHAAVFKGSIEEIHKPNNDWEVPGHPADTLKKENLAIEREAALIRGELDILPDASANETIAAGLVKLAEIDRHYLKKENLFFPFMEKYGITAPPKVMWGVDDEIRAELKELRKLVAEGGAEPLKQRIAAALTKVTEMIFKEENIMLPMLMEALTQDDWKVAADGSVEFGYSLIEAVPAWKPTADRVAAEVVYDEKRTSGALQFPTGVLKMDELIGMLNTLPVDITFVDKDDRVKYFSQAAERIFPRTTSIIGRHVTNCHPPASMYIVEKIVADLKAGRKDHEDFWIHMGGKYVFIRYFAVRNEAGEYLGCLEVTQDIQPIQEITGEKRLMSE